MASPLGSMLGTGLGIMSAPVIGGIGSAFGGMLTDEVKRQAWYVSNYKYPNVPYSVDSVTRAFLTGDLSNKEYIEAARLLGHTVAPITSNHDLNVLGFFWQRALLASMPFFNSSDIIVANKRGLIGQIDYEQGLKWSATSERMRATGEKIIQGNYSPGDIILMYIRGILPRSAALYELKKINMMNDTDNELLLSLANIIPGPSDLVRFAIREAFKSPPPAELQLDAEYNENGDFQAWCRAQGLGEMQLNIPGFGPKAVDWARMYWRAHWIMPAPTQLYQMLHRLRLNRLDRFPVNLTPADEVTIKEVEAGLKADDYSPAWRKRLAAISYHEVGRIDIRRLYRTRVIDAVEVKEKYLDLGYVERDAKDLTELTIREDEDKKDLENERKNRQYYQKIVAEILEGYKLGGLTRAMAETGLGGIYDDDKLIKALLDAIDLKIQNAKVRAFVRMIEQEFYLGLYSTDQAYNELMGAGIQPSRVASYVELWGRKLSKPRKIASTDKLLDWVKRGLMTIEHATMRLQTLGWLNSDILMYLAETVQDIERERVRQEMIKAREAKQIAEATRRLMAQQEAAARRARADFEKHSSPAIMRSWYRQGLIPADDVIERLVFLGWPPDDISRYMAELQPSKNGQG